MGTAQAELTTYGFDCITNNSAAASTIGEKQLFVDVMSVDGYDNQVLFWFRNTGPEACNIAEIYFDDDSLLRMSLLIDRQQLDRGGNALVDFQTTKINPGNLPGGNALTPAFNVTTGLAADTESPGPTWGVGAGEWLGILTKLRCNQTYDDVLMDLASGDLRIGLHVGSFDDGCSESYVNSPKGGGPPPVPVPAPGAAVLGAIGLGMTGWLGRKRLASA